MLLTFLIGFSVPLFARRLIKIFPEDAGTSFAYMLTPRKIKLFEKSEHTKKRNSLFLKLTLLCIFYGTVFSVGIDTLAVNYSTSWMLMFAWMLFVLLEIDKRSMLLPDVLTVPLIILGFAYACFGIGNINPMDSAIGAMFGYFIPVISSGLMSFFKKDSMGGGDIKILAGLGAWLGLYYLCAAILVSFIIFTAIAIYNRNRTGPYGPAIVLASIIAMYSMNINFLAKYISF